MINYLLHLSTFTKHLTLLCMTFVVYTCGNGRGKVLNVIKSIYTNLKSRVKFDNRVSSDFTCCLGVKQGECLSPILFSMYLYDI